MSENEMDNRGSKSTLCLRLFNLSHNKYSVVKEQRVDGSYIRAQVFIE